MYVLCFECHTSLSEEQIAVAKHILITWVTWGCLKRGRDCLPLANTWGNLRFLVASVLLIVLIFCVVKCFLFHLLVILCPMSPVTLHCAFLIAPPVFSNAYLLMTVADWRWRLWGVQPPPPPSWNKSSTYINIRFSRLFNITIWLLIEYFRFVWWK